MQRSLFLVLHFALLRLALLPLGVLRADGGPCGLLLPANPSLPRSRVHALVEETVPILNRRVQQDEVVQEILQYQVDGVVMASVTLSSHIAQECASLGVPVVLFNRYVENSQTSSVVSDNITGGKLIAELLIKEGHKQIAFIAGQENSSTNVERERGFTEGLSAQGLSLCCRAVGNYNFEDAAAATRKMLSDNVPDAIFVANDHMAFAVMDVIRGEFGLKIPEDISVVGYDNVPEAGWPSYNLTTIEQSIEQMINATVEILLEQMEHKQVSATKKVTPATLILRGSTKSSLSD